LQKGKERERERKREKSYEKGEGKKIMATREEKTWK